jgi:hypothetical protein
MAPPPGFVAIVEAKFYETGETQILETVIGHNAYMVRRRDIKTVEVGSKTPVAGAFLTDFPEAARNIE